MEDLLGNRDRCIGGDKPRIEPGLNEHFENVAWRKPDPQRGCDKRLQRGQALQRAQHRQRTNCALSERELRSPPNSFIHRLCHQVVQTRHRRSRGVEPKACRDLLASVPCRLAGHDASPLSVQAAPAGASKSKIRSSMMVREPLG